MSEASHVVHVTVVSALGQLRTDLPDGEPVAAFLADLLAATGLSPSPAAARPDRWQLAVTDGATLSADRSLADQDVKPGAMLHLRGVSTASETWAAVVRADRQYFDSVMRTKSELASSTRFPENWPPQDIPLTGTEVQIGRRSTARGIEPDIDLSGPPPDIGVSRKHAVLLAEPDGSWAVLDLGSANGTLLNGVEITPHQRTPVGDGDQISLGRWTVLTIHVE